MMISGGNDEVLLSCWLFSQLNSAVIREGFHATGFLFLFSNEHNRSINAPVVAEALTDLDSEFQKSLHAGRLRGSARRNGIKCTH